MSKLAQFDEFCYGFKEAGDRIVAVVGWDVMVLEHLRFPHICSRRCSVENSLLVEQSKAYFASFGEVTFGLDHPRWLN